MYQDHVGNAHLQLVGNDALDEAVTASSDDDVMPLGKSHSMCQLRESIARVAGSETTVLIQGETGSGKEVVARAIHDASSRSEGPFIAVNCGAIPGDLLESELFGHEKGAFTGAVTTRKGRFELAAGGTLFLDEIGDMPLMMQVKLLRVLQERRFERVGSNRSLRADVRIIAATHRDLRSAIDEGGFREDLFYRLNVFPLAVPPLRDRDADVDQLATYLGDGLRDQGLEPVRFSKCALRVLRAYAWPGNVRELANLVEQLSVYFPGREVTAEELPGYLSEPVANPVKQGDRLPAECLADLADDSLPAEQEFGVLPDDGLDLRDYLQQLEVSLILQSLKQTRGVVARAAELLQIRRTTLVEKMRKYHIQREAVA